MIAAEGTARNSVRQCRVLLVDDEPAQLKLGRLRLEAAGYIVETASNADEALERTEAEAPDAIVSDVLMDGLDGFGLCRKLREDARLEAVPVILLSAHCEGTADIELSERVGAAHFVSRTPDFSAELAAIDATLAHRCVAKAGPADSALYEQLLRRNATQITKLLGKAQSAEERYRMLFSHANDAIAFLTPAGVILEANERWRALLGVEPAAMVGRHIRDFSPSVTEARKFTEFERTLMDGSGRSGAVPLLCPDGSIVVAEFSLSTVEIAGQRTILSIARDVTTETLARQALATAEERYRTLLERIPDVVWTCTTDRRLVFATPNIVRILGYTLQELNAQSVLECEELTHPDDRAVIDEAIRSAGKIGKMFDIEYRIRHKHGHFIWVRNRMNATYVHEGTRYIEGMISDINERKLLEESFRQAQKMEAIGQLTGGIAHDFNNILAAILAYSHFLTESLADHDPRRTDVGEIRIAAERAAGLTRQLLAFSRRQVLQPAVVDLNAAVAGLERMLCRLIGEDITLTVVPGEELGAVKVDVGQLEQVIMNLVVNARDAMPAGGRITLELANVDVDAAYAASHVPVPLGKFVMLTVCDAGSGMDDATKRRLFEPFFTTKERGKGTGLGLSTCYGIVKQSGGYIYVDSAPGRGSVFEIYLPRVAAAETPIDLVLTDVVMPGASGPEVAELVRARFPAKVLFMSGYTDHAVLRDGVLEPGLCFIQKPFSSETLARKLRAVLDA